MRLALLAFTLCASTSHAQGIAVQFADGAPKDSITFENNGCALEQATIVIDLSKSKAGLIFDTTAGGDGVEVYQPIEVLTPDVTVSPVADGGKVLHIYIPQFPNGATVRLTADLDDTTSARQITVNGSEMAGATVSLAMGALMETAPFGTDGAATLLVPPTENGCLST